MVALTLALKSRHYSKITELPKNQSNITTIFNATNKKLLNNRLKGRSLKGFRHFIYYGNLGKRPEFSLASPM